MAGLRFLHVADLHLGRSHSALGDRADQRQDEADRLLSRLTDLALELRAAGGLAAFLIAGDLFENPRPPQSLVGAVIADLKRLDAAGILPVTVPGNHDELSYPDGVYRRYAGEWPGILVTRTDPGPVHTLRAAGEIVHLYSMAYVEGESPPVLPTFSVAEAGVHLGLFHAALDPALRDRSLKAPVDVLAGTGLDYVALGHLHRPEQVPVGTGLAVYPGLMEGGSFDDPGGAAPVLGTVSGGEVTLAKADCFRRELETREFDLSNIPDEEELVQALQGLADPERILRARLTGISGFTSRTDYLRELLAESFYYLEIVEDYCLLGSARVAELARQDTVQGVFVRRMRQKMETAADDDERQRLEIAFRQGLAAFERD